jgi:hypothetical protein
MNAKGVNDELQFLHIEFIVHAFRFYRFADRLFIVRVKFF